MITADAIRHLLLSLGEDPDREGLRETPARVAKMYKELLHPPEFKFTVFDSEGMDQLVVQTEIPFHSLCEHHLLPFMGTAAVCYIPAGKIVGLSKLARAVQYCARGFQNQERVTMAVADLLEKHLAPSGIGVILRARHLCMEMRGVKAHDVYTTTSCMRGFLLTEASARAEFLGLAR